MQKKMIMALCASGALGFAISTVLAAPSPLPGDHGRPGDGMPMMPRPGAQPAPPRPPDVVARAIDEGLALKAALAIAKGCKQYPMALAVVNVEGVATLIYVPNGSAAWHGYSAVRKAYAAVTFKAPTSQLIGEVQHDAAMAEKVKADPNLQVQSGGVPMRPSVRSGSAVPSPAAMMRSAP